MSNLEMLTPQNSAIALIDYQPAMYQGVKSHDRIVTFNNVQPDVPVPNTAGRPGAYTGSYGQLRVDGTIDRATAFAVEAVHFVVGDALRNAGAHDSNYLGVEVKHGW